MLLVSCIVPYFLVEILLVLGFVEKYGHNDVVNILVLGDVIFVASFFVLGGEFWSRVNRLFQWPGKTTAEEGSD